MQLAKLRLCSSIKTILFIKLQTLTVLKTKLVISFTGTNDFVDKLNWTIGLPIPAPQLFQAIDFYFAAKAAHPGATNITFTGHSLGGGLAALMAVYFNKHATVFDEAPFQLTAVNPIITAEIVAYMLRMGYSDDAFLIDYAQSPISTPLIREVNVSHHYLEGEILDYPRYSFDTLVGYEREIDMGSSNATGVQLHSMALMTAIESSEAFYNAVKKLPDLVSMLADDNLFGAGALNDDNKQDLLRKVLRHELGIAGEITPDQMLTRFASDMKKLAQDGGLTMNDGHSDASLHNVSKALIAFAMQFYYEDTTNAKDPDKTLFTDLTTTNGIEFDIRGVSKTFKEVADGEALKLNEAKGFKEFFSLYLNDPGFTFTAEERNLMISLLPYMREWHVQAGTAGMDATDMLGLGSFMLGGATDDNLTGGIKSDLLVGNAGHDTLNGGDGDDVLIGGFGQDTLKGDAGNDVLLGGANEDILDGGDGNDLLKGGAGMDVYQFNGTYGIDIITDKDGEGFVTIDNNPIISHYKTSKYLPCRPISMSLPEHAFKCFNRAKSALFNLNIHYNNTHSTAANDAIYNNLNERIVA